MDRLASTESRFPAAEQLAQVLANDWVNDEYKHLRVTCGVPAVLAEPGQFFHLLCPPSDGDAPFLRRPMSVYHVDKTQAEVAFLYKVTGAGTRGLATLVAGDRLNMVGPLGIGFRLDPAWKNIVVVGRGVGLATLAPLAEAARGMGIGVTAILSARRSDLLMSVEFFRERGATVIAITDDEGSSSLPNVERMLGELIDAGKADAFFTCGSNRLLKLLQHLGETRGVPGEVALEQQMACGLGMCFCCVREFRGSDGIEHRRVCWEGPVFDLKEAVSW